MQTTSYLIQKGFPTGYDNDVLLIMVQIIRSFQFSEQPQFVSHRTGGDFMKFEFYIIVSYLYYTLVFYKNNFLRTLRLRIAKK